MSKRAPQLINAEQIGVPLLSLSLPARLVRAHNQEGRELLSADELALSALLAPEEERRLIELSERSLRSGLTLKAQRPFSRPQLTTSRQRFELTISPCADGELLLTCVDLQRWEGQLEATRRNTDFLQRLIDLTSTLFFVVDRQGLVTFANEAFTRHCQLGVSHDEGGGLGAAQQLSPAHVPQLEELFYEQLEQCFSEQSAQRTQLIWANAQGERCVFQLMMQPLLTQGGQAEQILVLGSEITELVDAYEEQKRLQSALGQAQRLEAIGQMAGTVAHDFNGFLTVMFSSLDLLELSELAEGDQELLRGMKEVCEQGRQLTQDLLALSRSQMTTAKRGELKRVDEHLNFALPRLSKAHAKVRYHKGEPLHSHLLGLSEAQCSQIIVNLVNNALDAMEEAERSGEVTVSCQSDEAGVCWRVQDQGVGIKPEHLESIFEPFFTTKRGRGGTGLGLPSARSLALKVGGDLRIETELGVGTLVIVELPKVEVSPSSSSS